MLQEMPATYAAISSNNQDLLAHRLLRFHVEIWKQLVKEISRYKIQEEEEENVSHKHCGSPCGAVQFQRP